LGAHLGDSFLMCFGGFDCCRQQGNTISSRDERHERERVRFCACLLSLQLPDSVRCCSDLGLMGAKRFCW
jgi:hypothetical protein